MFHVAATLSFRFSEEDDMASNEYHFITTWRIKGSPEEIAGIIADAQALARWWPSVYLDVREIEPGAPSGVGKRIDLYTKGWLPYTLRWQFLVTEVEPYRRIALEAEGDFVGRGVWTFTPDDDHTIVTYDWRIRADKPLLRALSPIFKPILSANHHWAMAQGEISLRLELARRRAVTDEERARIPPPPGPTATSPLPLALGIAAVLGGIGLVVAGRRRASR